MLNRYIYTATLD